MRNHPILDLWPRILEYGQEYSLPQPKKANIVREYLQNKILEKIYNQNLSREIFFVGGTSLRILRGLDRFSEDLDFDLGQISQKLVEKIFDNLVVSFKKENFPVEGYKNLKKKRNYYELRFPEILYLLGISQNPKQKLVIKLDFSKFWRELNRDVVLVEKYGFIYRANTLTKDQILSEKIHAYCFRQQTLARDLYDIIWLLNDGAKIDWQFLKKNSFKKNIIKTLKKRFRKDEERIVSLNKTLQPLLINEENARRIYLFSYYFPEVKEIEYQGMDEFRSGLRDAYELRYRFLVKKEKKIVFTIVISGSAMVNLDEDLKKRMVNKILSFYQFNPTISYRTKIITSYTFEDFRIAEDEEISSFLE